MGYLNTADHPAQPGVPCSGRIKPRSVSADRLAQPVVFLFSLLDRQSKLFVEFRIGIQSRGKMHMMELQPFHHLGLGMIAVGAKHNIQNDQGRGRSMKRREKEQAMISKAEERFIKDAEALRALVTQGRLKDPEKILKKIGALLAKHPRVARSHEVRFTDGAISILKDDSRLDAAYDLCGDYVLRTDQHFQADELWTLYMTLLKAEAGFKMLKRTLSLRPNFHQKEFRVDGHIFITVLAYHLLCWIHNRLATAGARRTWRTIRRLLRTHCLLTTRFPLEDGRIVSIRKASVPDEEQIRIYNMLGINWKSAYQPGKTQINS